MAAIPIQNKAELMGNRVIYKVKNLVFSYPEADRRVLDNCSFSLKKGEILSILGPNGAGKSTLLNCVCGLLTPQSGEIELCGINIKNLTNKQIAQKVGYVQQKYHLVFSYFVIDFVTMGRAASINMFRSPGKKDRQLAYEALEELGITHLAMKDFTQLSGGEQQQVTIARAIVQKPKVILFDEPTAHLDYGKQIMALRLISKLANSGYAIIMTTHNPDHAILLGGTVGILDKDGTLQTGPTDSIITQKRLEEIYETKLCLLPIEELARRACLPPNL